MKWRLDPEQIEVVDEVMVPILRAKSPAERIQMAADCNVTVRFLVAAAVFRESPQLSEEQVHAEVARRMLRTAMRQNEFFPIGDRHTSTN